jgi:hypothetical protein
MFLLRGLLDRLLLVSMAVAGGLLPGFITQYRQRLGGRLDQAQLDLGEWQKIADRFFQGDLGKLAQNHLDSSDPVIQAEGHLVRSLMDTVQGLQSAVDALQGTLWHQIPYLALHTDRSVALATLDGWTPTFSLAPDGLIFAAAFAAIVWLAFQSLWWLGALVVRKLRSTTTNGANPPPERKLMRTSDSGR